jgi:PAS domain S-box-containing protein
MIGDLKEDILEAILETIPIEFSVLNKEDEVLAWNKHETRIFKRPKGVVGRNVRQCHPEKSLHKVEKILSEMKEGTRDKARFWIDLQIPGKDEKQKVMIEYYALRDKNGKYIGCLEASQNISDVKNLIGQKRLLN